MSTDLSELICPDCGARDQSEAFCDSCGAALSRVEPVEVVEPVETVELADVVEAEVPADTTERARALLVPVADQRLQADAIAPVLPGRPDPQAPQREGADQLEALDAGIECQWCATRNPPERHFCRRCGQRLAYAPVEAKPLPWWRRVFFFWRNRPLPFAGQRPRLRRGPGGVVRVAVWGAVVVVLVVVVVQQYKPASAEVRDHFAKPNEVSNWTVEASHQDPNHPAKLLHDTYSDTWWGSGYSPQNTNGTCLTVTFTQPANLLDMGLTPGAGTAADTFGTQGAPQTIDVELIPIPGKGAPVKKTITVDDQPGFQKFELRGDDIRQVVLTITSSYPPIGDSPAKAVETAVSEVEFYTRH